MQLYERFAFPASCAQPFAAVLNRPSMITLPFVINLNVMRHQNQAAELEVLTTRYESFCRIIIILKT